MFQAIQSAFGEEGVERLIAERMRQQIESYRGRMPGPGTPLEQRVGALARIQREEGYMAEWHRRRDEWDDRARGKPLFYRQGRAAVNCRSSARFWAMASLWIGSNISLAVTGGVPTASASE
jgi:hypothetical protein